MLKGTRFIFRVLCVILSAQSAFAWGHNGHEIVASVAARLLVEKESMSYLRDNEYALGYYTNVPDMIWKSLGKEIFNTEHPLHYFDWNDKYRKIFGSPQALPENFDDFKIKMGADFNPMDGESPWRIKQFFEKCQELSKDLNFEKQGPLLVCMGELSHYIGDLSQPLHVTDNFNGQLSGQKGIHSFFEDDMINFLDPQLKVDVLNAALKKYAAEVAKKKTYGERVRDLIAVSNTQVRVLLKMDKKFGRDESLANAKNYKAFAADCLVRGAVTTALVWKEIFKNVKNFDNHKFYYFDGKPEYVQPDFMK